MLEAQRKRHSTLRAEVGFTRRLLVAHMGMGAAGIGLLALHGRMEWALGMALWYLVSLMPVAGILHGRSVSRFLLGCLFLLFSFTGVYLLTHDAAASPPSTFAVLPPELLSVWMGGMNLVYAGAGVCLLLNRKVRRAANIGFALW